jgi:transcriptional regulator with XRE-family HTH domain
MANEDEERRAYVLKALRTPLGDVVRRWRLYRGLSLRQLGEVAHIQTGYLSQIENNKIAKPNEKYLAQLASGLGLEKEDLLIRLMPPEGQNGSDIQSSSIQDRRSRPAEPQSPAGGSGPPTLGQAIDSILAAESVSPEEQQRISEVVVPLTRLLVQVFKRRQRS